ncbi:MAG TPA: GTP-binding protein [Victivallales bacterium]|nr:GTP-binding protein [Victivallales bacterium]
MKDERAQGITIDMARCFFKTTKRKYLIMDAPGHIEFLKNMVTGAARAEAALLVIDANEGIMENSKRHGYLLSMLGIKQIAVLVNKMDLVNYSKEKFDKLVSEYSKFLNTLKIKPLAFIPISAVNGDNIAIMSKNMNWYNGKNVLELVDLFEKSADKINKPFRMPIQDIYKFTEGGDDRRIVAGTVETGTISVGDTAIFWPSGKESIINSIEEFNAPKRNSVGPEKATGFTLKTQIYIKPGEIMTKKGEKMPYVSSKFQANVFWMGRSPFIKGKRYKLKIGSDRTFAELVEVVNVIDAAELNSFKGKQQLDRHDVGLCVIETSKPVTFDLIDEIEYTGRFVIVDNYDIAGGGIIVKKADEAESLFISHIKQREFSWEKGYISPKLRSIRNHHKGKFIVLTGDGTKLAPETSKILEEELFNMRFNTYYMGISNIKQGLEIDLLGEIYDREEHIRRIGELARIFTDAGMIFITSIERLDKFEAEKLRLLNSPNEIIIVNMSDEILEKADFNFSSKNSSAEIVNGILKLLGTSNVIPNYVI